MEVDKVFPRFFAHNYPHDTVGFSGTKRPLLKSHVAKNFTIKTYFFLSNKIFPSIYRRFLSKFCFFIAGELISPSEKSRVLEPLPSAILIVMRVGIA